MRRSERNKGEKLDYKLLASTRKRSTTSEGMASDDKLSNVSNYITESVVKDEIEDFINGNSPESIQESPDLMMSCVKKIETLRIQFRTQHRIIKHEIEDEQYEEAHNKSFQNRLTSISHYIKDVNQLLQHGSSTKRHKATFLQKKIDRFH